MMDVLVHYREQKKYIVHEFVIMPDHLHLLLTPAADLSLERAVQLIKGGFSYRLGKSKRGPVWQESFTNHRVRDKQDYERHAEYIRMNPVRARLVERPGLYPYSSSGPTFQRSLLDTAMLGPSEPSATVEERPFMAAQERANYQTPFRACVGRGRKLAVGKVAACPFPQHVR